MSFIGGHLTNCPLPTARPTEGVYFRLLPSGSLSERDFKSRAKLCEEGLDYRGVDINNCGEHAISLCTSFDAAERVKKRYPKSYAHAKIAKVELNASHGPLDSDKPGHANWWHPVDFNPLTIASLAEEEGS